MAASLDRSDPTPLYKQVKVWILSQIYDGATPVQRKVPSERQLVEELGVSRITVRQALKELQAEGHLQSQPGKGFYATGGARKAHEVELLRSFTEMAQSLDQVPDTKTLHVGVEPCPETVSSELSIEAGSLVTRLKRVRFLDNLPVAITEDWVPVSQAPDLATLDWADGSRSLYAELIYRYRVVPHRGFTNLSAALATPEDCRLLDLDPGAAVLSVTQVAYDQDDKPINYTLALHHPQRYPLTVTQRR